MNYEPSLMACGPEYRAHVKNTCPAADGSFNEPPFEDQHIWKAFHDYLFDDDARSVDVVGLGVDAAEALTGLVAVIALDIGKSSMNRFFSVVASSCVTTASASCIRS